MGKKHDEAASKVAERFDELNKLLDVVGAKIRAWQPPNRAPSVEDAQRMAEGKTKFAGLQKIRRVMGHKIEAMDLAPKSSPEKLRIYEHLLATIDQSVTGLRELDKILDANLVASKK
jgi:hypothetical protein